MRNKKYDIIIIGTGAGGATMLHELAPTGKSILVIERGDFLPKEKENIDSKEVFLKGRYVTKEQWITNDGKVFTPGQHYWVGGNTKMYGATLLRMREKDFDNVKHIDGTSEAWPIKYKQFEKYYQKAEELYHVHGESDIDPTEPTRSKEFPYPPLPHEPRIQQLFNDLKKAKLKPFPLPTGVMLDSDKRTTEKVVLDRLDGYPDITGVKADAHTTCIKPTLNFSNVTLKTNAYVEKLIADKAGKKIEKIKVKERGKITYYTSSTVIVSCGAINSAALFLRSESKQYPNGLANSSGLVGRYLMLHNNSVFMAFSKTPNNTKFGKTIGINDYYYANKRSKWPLGHIQMLGKVDNVIMGSAAPKFIPKSIINKLAKHSIDLWITTEDLPLYENRVTLTKEGQIQLHYKQTNIKTHKLLTKKLAKLLGELGCYKRFYKTQMMGIDKVSHQCGTLRFGKDQKKSVLDTNCKVHDLDNVYVVDSSFFVSSSSVNPALTVIANAIRVSDYLKKNVL